MANTDNPHGLNPIGRLDGGADVVRIMTKLAAYGAAVGINDPVVHASTQNNFQIGVTLSPIYGISLRYSATSTLAIHPIQIVSNASILEAQEDGTIGVASEGLNIDFVIGGPSTVTGISTTELNSATEAVTATLDFHILQVAPYPDNDGTAANARWFVVPNNAALGQQALGVA